MIIATAGHIDHGKTALVRVLTGIDTDRLAEEKRRGMSIDLGFAFIDLPDGTRAGVVDVPGHENFIRNMLAGAHCIDLFLLVVAADDGVMPQTREHMDIVDLLGVSKGVAAVTKTDLVEASRVEEVRREVNDLLRESGIGEVPVVAVSSTTREGVDDLVRELLRLSAGTSAGGKGFFRMPVDRSFTVRGFGTVVTGTVVSGRVSPGDMVKLHPGGRELRVRNVESHGERRDEVRAGERGALNLAGIEKGEIRRGDVLTAPALARDTLRFDARVRSARFSGRPLKSGERVHLHVGTADVIATFFPYSVKELPAGGWCHAAFRLSRPVQVMRRDRFVVRDYSARATLAGGVVLNPFGAGLKSVDTREYFSLWEEGDVTALAREILKRSGGMGKIDEIAENLDIEPEEMLEALGKAGDRFRVIGDRLLLGELIDSAEERIRKVLTSYHRENPAGMGMEVETVRRKAGCLPARLFREVVDGLAVRGVLEKRGVLLRIRGAAGTMTPEERRDRSEIISVLREKGYRTASEALLTGGDRRKRGCLQAMVKEGGVVRLSRDSFILPDLLDRAGRLLLDHFKENDTISVVEFKNILGTGRKGAILILEYFDGIGLTMRQGDGRILLKRG